MTFLALCYFIFLAGVAVVALQTPEGKQMIQQTISEAERKAIQKEQRRGNNR